MTAASRLSPLQSHLLALALLAILVAGAVALVAWPTWLLHRHYDNAIDDSLDRLGRYRRIVAMRPAIEEAIAAVSQRDARKNYYWKANTAALAAAEIQAAATRIIESNGGKVFSSQSLPAATDTKTAPGAPGEVSVVFQITASAVPLHLLLHAIELSQPYLVISQLSVRANQGRVYRPMPGIQPEYTAQLTVRGYFLAGAAKS